MPGTPEITSALVPCLGAASTAALSSCTRGWCSAFTGARSSLSSRMSSCLILVSILFSCHDHEFSEHGGGVGPCRQEELQHHTLIRILPGEVPDGQTQAAPRHLDAHLHQSLGEGGMPL